MASNNADVIVSSTQLLETPLLPPENTVAGAVDYKRRPAVRSKHGRWRSASFIIVVEVVERMSYCGISQNLINFLTGELGQSTAVAAANVNAWSGVVNLLPLFGAAIADSFLGKYYTIVAASLLYILGLGLLTRSAMLPFGNCLFNEKGLQNTSACLPRWQVITFFISLYLVAIAEGGHRPCAEAFGADQFDGEDLEESKAKSSFFNWWYIGVCIGALLGVSVMSYIQDNLSWSLAFGVQCIMMVFALVIFSVGTTTYRYIVKVDGPSPLMRIGRVFAVAARNRFLEKASLSSEILKVDGKVCSTTEVEEAKAILRLFPIWATSLVFGIAATQPGTLFTKQGVTLDRSIGSSFIIPAASLQSFLNLCIIFFLPFYDRVLVPIARSFTGKPAGISTLQRIGTGIFLSILTMILAAVIEKKRLETALEHGLFDLRDVTIPMSIWWLLPQYVLFGIAQAFSMVGLQEFFYDNVPNELRSMGMSLYLSVLGIGDLLSSFLVSVINKATTGEGGESWFSDNLNYAHLDYYYWFLASLSAVGLTLFIYCAKAFIHTKPKR